MYTRLLGEAFQNEFLGSGGGSSLDTIVRLSKKIDNGESELLYTGLKDIRDKGFRIIYVAILHEQLPYFFEKAANLSMIHDGYTYLISTNGTFRASGSGNATGTVMKGSFVASFHPTSRDKELVDALKKSSKKDACYGRLEDECPECRSGEDGAGNLLWEWDDDGDPSTPDFCVAAMDDWVQNGGVLQFPASGYAVDAVVALLIGIARTLNATEGDLAGADLRDELSAVSFSGLTGNVSFIGATGDRKVAEYDIRNFSGYNFSIVATVSNDDINIVDLKEFVFSTGDNSFPEDGCLSDHEYLNAEYFCSPCAEGTTAESPSQRKCTTCGKESCDGISIDFSKNVTPVIAAFALLVGGGKVYLMKRRSVNHVVSSFLLRETFFTALSACGDLGDIATDLYSYVLVLSTDELAEYWPWCTFAVTVGLATSLHAFFIRCSGLYHVWVTNQSAEDHELLGLELWGDKLLRARRISNCAVFTALWEDLPHVILYSIMMTDVLWEAADFKTRRVISTSMAVSLGMFGYRMTNLGKVILVGPMEQMVRYAMRRAKHQLLDEESKSTLRLSSYDCLKTSTGSVTKLLGYSIGSDSNGHSADMPLGHNGTGNGRLLPLRPRVCSEDAVPVDSSSTTSKDIPDGLELITLPPDSPTKAVVSGANGATFVPKQLGSPGSLASSPAKGPELQRVRAPPSVGAPLQPHLGASPVPWRLVPFPLSDYPDEEEVACIPLDTTPLPSVIPNAVPLGDAEVADVEPSDTVVC
eukprot:Rmarinus@m.23109